MGLAGVGVGISAAGLAANVGGKIAGSMGSSGAAKTAGAQEAASTQQGIDFATGTVYPTAQAGYAPYIGAGQNALGAVSQFYGLPTPAGLPAGAGGNAMDAYNSFTKTPFYQFPLKQGIEAMDRSGASRGMTLSGGQLAAQQQYGQDYGSKNFQTYVNGLTSLAGLGQQSVGNLSNIGTALAGGVLKGYTDIGMARGAGTIGGQNGVNNALSGLGPLGQGASDLVKQIGALNSSSYAPGTSGGFNNGADLVNSDGSVVTPPIPPDSSSYTTDNPP